MKGKQTALMPGNGDKVGYWLTPWTEPYFAALRTEFDFDHDACPYPRPGGYNGLKEPWGKRTWVNPPFVGHDSSRSAWARKMITEQTRGNTSVLIVPMDRWVGELLKAGAEVRVPPPFKWLDPQGRPQVSGRPSLIFILRPRP